MLILISYDISDDKKRARIFKILSSYGISIQLSIFECDISDKDIAQLKEKLYRVIDPNIDKLKIYHICSLCNEKIVSFNSIGISEKLKSLVI